MGGFCLRVNGDPSAFVLLSLEHFIALSLQSPIQAVRRAFRQHTGRKDDRKHEQSEALFLHSPRRACLRKDTTCLFIRCGVLANRVGALVQNGLPQNGRCDVGDCRDMFELELSCHNFRSGHLSNMCPLMRTFSNNHHNAERR